MFLAITSPGFTQTSQTATLAKQELSISVYDYAHVPTAVLAEAEQGARRIFQQAGVETVWVTCLPRPEKIESHACDTVNTTHLMLKILPHAFSAQVRDRSNV